MPYFFWPQVLYFFATVPLVGLEFHLFLDVFEQLGELTPVRDCVSHNGDRLWLHLKKDGYITKGLGDSALLNQMTV